MKLHSFIVDLIIFLLIFAFFIVPPIFFTANPVDVFVWQFPLAQIIMGIIAGLILLFYFDFKHEKNTDKMNFLLKKVFPGIMALCLLFFCVLTIKAIDCFLLKKEENLNFSVIKPDSFITFLYCFLNFFLAAFYEEVIYRFFLPEFLHNFIFRKVNNKIIYFVIEILALLLFALGHIYLGWLAVLNAVFAHFILRLCLIKSKSIFPGFAAHFIYNLMVLFLL